MEKILVEENYLLEYIKDMINTFKLRAENISHKYHHNASYSDTKSICQHGILSIRELHNLGIKKYTEKELKLMDDTDSHVNGCDKISLSIVGLTDLYSHEEEYNPYLPGEVDILISEEVKASRCSFHYGNEFLASKIIEPSKFRALDVRFLKLIHQFENKQLLFKNLYNNQSMVDKYNKLREIALLLDELHLNIPLREMSSGSYEIDTLRLAKTPELGIKL